jgi:hypothetical protein
MAEKKAPARDLTERKRDGGTTGTGFGVARDGHMIKMSRTAAKKAVKKAVKKAAK